jgi:hypothetical protein
MAVLHAAPQIAPTPSDVDEVNSVSTSDRRTSSATVLSIFAIPRILETMLATILPWRRDPCRPNFFILN